MATPELNAGSAFAHPIGDIRVHHTGVVTGAFFAAFHFAWALLVAVNWAQPLLDFVYWLHFIRPVFVVEPFNVVRALILLVTTALVGYVLGAAFAFLWNRLHR